MKCMSSNDCTHVSMNHTVTFNCSAVYIFVYSIPKQIFSYIILGHYPITNSNGTCLKLNYNFDCCKTVFLKILRSLKG